MPRMTHNLPDEYLAQLLSQQMQSIARRVKKELAQIPGNELGFCVIVSGPGRLQYVSNCDRTEMAEALTSLVERWKTQKHIDVPHHEDPLANDDDYDVVQLPTGPEPWGKVKKALEMYEKYLDTSR